MNITFDKLTLEIDRNEAALIYFAFKHSLEQSIDRHWKNFPDSYEKSESPTLGLMKCLSRVTNDDFEFDAAQLKQRLLVK